MFPGQHRSLPLVNNRIPELLESLKAEFESLAHDVNLYKLQRDDYERALQLQLSEVANIQNSMHELERRHNAIAQKYEEEISRFHKDNFSDIKSAASNLRSLHTIISKEMTGKNNNNITGPDSEKPTLPSLQNKSNMLPNIIDPISPLKIGNVQIPSQPNNLNLHTPNIPIPEISQIKPINTSSTPSPLLGSKRKADSPEKSPFYPHIGIMNNLPTKAVKKEIDDTPTSLHSHSPEQLDKDREHFSSFSNFGKNITGSFAQNNSNIVSNGNNEISANSQIQDMKNDNEDKSEWSIRYTSPQKTIDVELSQEILHKSVVCCVKFSNDGKYLATGSNRKAQIFSVADGKKQKCFRGGTKEGDLYLRSVCFSPDGKYLACGAEDKTIKLWDIEENKIFHTFVSHTMDIYSLDYSLDGNLIVSGSGDKKVKLWDVQKGKCLFTLGTDEIGPKDGVTSVTFSPDLRTIAAGSLDRIVRLWDVETGSLLDRFEGHLDSVYSVSFSMDGKSLASGSLDKTLKLWDSSEPRSRGKCVSTFIGHTDFVLSVAFSPDDKWLISGSKDRSVQFWDPRTVSSHCKLEGHKNSVISVAINPVAGKFATGSGDSKAKIWNYHITQP